MTILVWHREATSPGCYMANDPSTHWPGDGYVYMQIRKLDENGNPAGTWSSTTSFSGQYSSCSNGRYFSEASKSLSGNNKWWPFWELRYINPSEQYLPNPTVYMLARTTAAGAGQCAPSYLRPLRSGSDSTVITWDDCDLTVYFFEVQRSTDGGLTWSNIGATAGYALYFRDFGLTPDARYMYRVRSVGAEGTSRWSHSIRTATLGATGSAWYRDFGEYWQVHFPDPELRVSADGQSLRWNKEAEAPTCSRSYWHEDGFVTMQLRKLDLNGAPVEAWHADNPFSPDYTACQDGRYFGEMSKSLSGINLGWPFWELRYVPYWQRDFANPRVLMLARTSSAGAGFPTLWDEDRELLPPQSPVEDLIENNCAIGPVSAFQGCVYSIMRTYTVVAPIRVNYCFYVNGAGSCTPVTYYFTRPANPPEVDDAHPENPPEGEGWTWEGSGPAGSTEGNWYRVRPDGKTDHLHPDFSHPTPKGPHWRWTVKDGNNVIGEWEKARYGKDWYPDGEVWWTFPNP